MAPKLPIDFVTKDYDGFLQMMKDQIPVLTPEWTDTSDSDQGIVILQLLAYGLHTLGFYQDKAVNENLLQNAQTKKAILLLCKFLGYEIGKQKPSQTTIRFTKDDTHIDQRVVIPLGTQVSTDPNFGEQIIFETDEALVIEAGEEYGEITATQGERVNREVVGLGTGLANQQYILEYPDVIEDSLQLITVENDKDYYWTRVDSFVDSKPNDRHFTTDLDEENRTIVHFGDGILGMRPLYQSNIFAMYRHGGGTIGNIATGLINTLVDTLVLGIGSVTNTVDAVGGQDYENLEHARVSAPKLYRTGGRAVTTQDFQDIAEKISGVYKALCQETFNANNEVNLYIATTDYSVPNQKFLDYIKAEIDKVRVMNCKVNVLSCLYKKIDISMDIYVEPNFVAESVKEQLTTALTQYFDLADFDMGSLVYTSQFLKVALLSNGVKNAVIKTPATDITCAFNEIPKLGTITLNVIGGV